MLTKEFLTKEQNIQITRLISAISKENGTSTKKKDEIREVFYNFYKNLYKKENIPKEIETNFTQCAGD